MSMVNAEWREQFANDECDGLLCCSWRDSRARRCSWWSSRCLMLKSVEHEPNELDDFDIQPLLVGHRCKPRSSALFLKFSNRLRDGRMWDDVEERGGRREDSRTGAGMTIRQRRKVRLDVIIELEEEHDRTPLMAREKEKAKRW